MADHPLIKRFTDTDRIVITRDELPWSLPSLLAHRPVLYGVG
jgi:hypothetical protein